MLNVQTITLLLVVGLTVVILLIFSALRGHSSGSTRPLMSRLLRKRRPGAKTEPDDPPGEKTSPRRRDRRAA